MTSAWKQALIITTQAIFTRGKYDHRNDAEVLAHYKRLTRPISGNNTHGEVLDAEG